MIQYNIYIINAQLKQHKNSYQNNNQMDYAPKMGDKGKYNASIKVRG